MTATVFNFPLDLKYSWMPILFDPSGIRIIRCHLWLKPRHVHSCPGEAVRKGSHLLCRLGGPIRATPPAGSQEAPMKLSGGLGGIYEALQAFRGRLFSIGQLRFRLN